MCYSSLPETAGGVSAILIPSVCRTVSTLPIWQVSLPFSRSMMKRSPVPEVSAKSFCVTPNRFRLSRTIWPISCAEYFTDSPQLFPYGNGDAFSNRSQGKNYRSGTNHTIKTPLRHICPDGNIWRNLEGRVLRLFRECIWSRQIPFSSLPSTQKKHPIGPKLQDRKSVGEGQRV